MAELRRPPQPFWRWPRSARSHRDGYTGSLLKDPCSKEAHEAQIFKLSFSRTSVLGLNLFWKAVPEAICSNTERRMADHTGGNMKRLTSWEPKFCSTTETCFFWEQFGWEPNCLRQETGQNQSLPWVRTTASWFPFLSEPNKGSRSVQPQEGFLDKRKNWARWGRLSKVLLYEFRLLHDATGDPWTTRVWTAGICFYADPFSIDALDPAAPHSSNAWRSRLRWRLGIRLGGGSLSVIHGFSPD